MIVFFADQVHPLLNELLSHSGFRCEEAFQFAPEELALLLSKEPCGMVIRSRFPVDAAFLTNAKALRFVARFGSGMENIDRNVAKACGIQLFSCPEGNSDAVADHTLGLMLGVMKKIVVSNKGVLQGKWERELNRGEELFGKTVAIFGYGNAGKAVVKRLAGFDCEVLIQDPYVNLDEGLPAYARKTNLKELYERADVVSMHVSLTDETTGLASDSFFNSFLKRIVYINTSRGAVTSSAALWRAIKAGKVDAAGLDVLDVEDRSFETLENRLNIDEVYALRNHPQCIITPHIAGWSNQSNERMANLLSKKIISAYRKQ